MGWQADLLGALGAPASQNNVAALTLWAQSEGVQQSNNPLAISGQHPGATTCIAQCGSSSPIYAYDSEASGVAATAAFLQGSYYTGVVQAFKQDAGLGGIWAAINQSPWCSGCQGGSYPEALLKGVSDPKAALAAYNAAGGATGATPGGGTSSTAKTSQFDTATFVKGMEHTAEMLFGLALVWFGLKMVMNDLGVSAPKPLKAIAGAGAGAVSGGATKAAGATRKAVARRSGTRESRRFEQAAVRGRENRRNAPVTSAGGRKMIGESVEVRNERQRREGLERV